MFDKEHFDFVKNVVFTMFSEYNDADLLLEESVALIKGYMYEANIPEYIYLIDVWYELWAEKFSKHNSETTSGTTTN